MGYVWGLLAIVLSLVGWAVATLVACALCTVCILLSLLLWFRGIGSIIEWCIWSFNHFEQFNEQQRCVIFPGEERRKRGKYDKDGDLWTKAVTIADKNCRDKGDGGSSQFDIHSFLLMTTGRNRAYLPRLTSSTNNFVHKKETTLSNETGHALQQVMWGTACGFRRRNMVLVVRGHERYTV